MAAQAGFFDFDERLVDLSSHGDPLERIAGVVDFELFRADLNAALGRSERREGRPGRPPLDPVVRPARSNRWRSGPHCPRF